MLDWRSASTFDALQLERDVLRANCEAFVRLVREFRERAVVHLKDNEWQSFIAQYQIRMGQAVDRYEASWAPEEVEV